MAISLDTEDRLDRGMSALDAMVGLLANQNISIGTSAANLACLLDLIQDDLKAALPVALVRRMGVNDNDDG